MNIDYKNINLNDWIQSGEGGTSFTYYHKTNDDIMLKVFKPYIDKNMAINEYNITNNVEKLGFIIPKAISLVDINDKKGIVYKRVKDKISFSRMMANDNNNIEYCAKEMAKFGKSLHHTKCNTKIFNNIKIKMQNRINDCDFNIDIKKSLQDLLNSTTEVNTCIHGDFQPSNFLNSNGNTYMIDLSTFSYGYHMYDIGALYFSCYVIITEKEKIDLFHMSLKDLRHFFDAFAKEYTNTNDKNTLNNFYKEAHRYSALIMTSVYQMLGRPIEKKKIYEDRIKEALTN